MTDEKKLHYQYIDALSADIEKQYSIDPRYYKSEHIKRGLRNADGTGVLAGVTRIGSVQGYVIEDGERSPIPGRLYYRGIDVMELVKAHVDNNTFGYEEVAYLLLLGKLPTKEQLEQFDAILSSARVLPDNFTEDMIIKAPSKNIMNKLERSILALYSSDNNPDDNSPQNVLRQSIELIGRFPIIVANAYAVKRHAFDGKSLYLHVPREHLSVSENFLRVVRKDKSYTEEEAHLLDIMLMVHAEHGGGNNSAFACRTLTSSGTDTYSAIAAAVGALKGPLHGGANAKVMEMFRDIRENVRDIYDDEELSAYLDKILAGTVGDHSGKIFGLGHAIYTLSDPRAEMIKIQAEKLAQERGRMDDFHLIAAVERIGKEKIMQAKNLNVPICANVDMYSGLVYSMLDIPEELYTPLFAIARIAGWCAHRLEELMTCNRIIRPAYRSAMIKKPYVPLEERK